MHHCVVDFARFKQCGAVFTDNGANLVLGRGCIRVMRQLAILAMPSSIERPKVGQDLQPGLDERRNLVEVVSLST